MIICHARPEQPKLTTKLWQEPGIEPSLEDMLADPLIHLVMQRDRVSRADVEKVINQTRARLMAAKACSDVKAA